jgi:hypothetical protein
MEGDAGRSPVGPVDEAAHDLEAVGHESTTGSAAWGVHG